MITVRMPDEELERLRQFAADDRRSMNEVVRLAVDEYLSRHDRAAAWERAFRQVESEDAETLAKLALR